MSIKLMSIVWDLDDPELTSSRLLVLLALADFANDEGINCYPSLPTLAQRARISTRQAQRVVQWLTDTGYIAIITKGNGSGHPTRYQVLPKGDKMSTYGSQKDDTVSTLNPPKGDKLSTFEGNKDDTVSTLCAKKGDRLSTLGTPKGDMGDAERMTSSAQRVTSVTEKGDIAMSTDPPIEPPIDPSGDPPGIVSAGAETPPSASEWVTWVKALCWVCHKHQELDALTEKDRGALTAEAKRICELGHASLSALKAWFQDDWQGDWRWKKDGQRPTPAQVRSGLAAHFHQRAEMAALMADSASHRRPVPAPPAATLPDDDPWRITVSETASQMPVGVLERAQAEVVGEDQEAQIWQITLDPQDADQLPWMQSRGAILLRRTLASCVRRAVRVDIVAPEQVAA